MCYYIIAPSEKDLVVQMSSVVTVLNQFLDNWKPLKSPDSDLGRDSQSVIEVAYYKTARKPMVRT